MTLEKLDKIVMTEFKTNLLPRIILSFFIILFAKVLYGFNNLNEIESLLPLERFIPLIGIFLGSIGFILIGVTQNKIY